MSIGANDRHLGPLEAAERLGVERRSVQRWIDEGELASHKNLGGRHRIFERDLLAFARERELPLREPHMTPILVDGVSTPSPRRGPFEETKARGVPDREGSPANLREMPHLLIAGPTGAETSTTLHALIRSILSSAKAGEVKFLMTGVELRDHGLIPHLLAPVVPDVRLAPPILEWAVEEMDRRYRWLAKAGVRDIESYNLGAGERSRVRAFTQGAEELPPERLPYIVLVVGELAKECEGAILRLAQMARATGIHLLLATQRPSTDVIPGVLEVRLPSRISARVDARAYARK